MTDDSTSPSDSLSSAASDALSSAASDALSSAVAGPPTNPSTAMAETLVDELARVGVRHVVVSPGSRSTALAIAFAAHGDLAVHVRIDERSAAFVALGIGRATGHPAVVVTTSGTAVANLAPAVVEADSAGVPMVVLTANRPAELHDVGANQTIRQHDLFAGRVRWRCRVPAASGGPGEPSWWRGLVDRAVSAARDGVSSDGVEVGRPGPVHLDVAFREPTVPGLDDGRSRVDAYSPSTSGRTDGAPWTAFHLTRSRLDVGWLADRLSGRRVLVVAGDAGRPMVDLAVLRSRGWPVVAEPTAGPHHGVGLAHGTLLLGADEWVERMRPEIVVRLGRPTLSRAVHTTLADVATIQVTSAGIVDPARTAADALVADPAEVLAALVDAVPDPPPPDWARGWTRAGEAAREVVAHRLDGASAHDRGSEGDTDAPVGEPTVARRVAAAVGDRPLVVASSLPIRDLDAYAAGTGGRVHANRGVSGIDGFTSTAVGVALASGPTVALAGDLSFLHDHNGMLVEDPAAVPLTLVVVDNDGGGLFHHVPAVQVDQFERLFATPHGCDLVAVARAAGIAAEAVAIEDVSEVVAQPSRGLQVVVVRTDRRHGAATRRAIADDLVARLAEH